MRIATFNVENLFSRARVMNQGSWDEGRQVLADYAALSSILHNDVYTPGDKENIRILIGKLGLTVADESKFVILRRNRGELLKRPSGGPVQVIASGRGDWIGWLELKTEAVNETATRMTAQVIKDVNADVLAVVEAENRISLSQFNEQLLKPLDADYGGVMLIDGNDERGIDVGLLTRPPITIESMVSHVDDMVNGVRVFSRDCPEFTVRAAGGPSVRILINHFKSKGYGPQAASNARRKAQAKRVREIYQQRRAEGIDMIVIAGDLNDTPASDPLKPLLQDGSDLKDIFKHPHFTGDGRPGTFGNGTASQKIDYLLLSPELFGRVTAGGVERRGVWGGEKGQLFPHYPEIKRSIHAASDHAAVWADITV